MGSVAVATKLRLANTYHFVSQSGETEVTYYSVAPGPPVEGVPGGALLEYAGPEGKLNFRSEQISQQDTPSGQLLSVRAPGGIVVVFVVFAAPRGEEGFTASKA